MALINIVLVDKSPLILAGLSKIFEDDERFSVMATAADGERFMEAVDRLSFDVAVIGWEMPFMSGRDVLTEIKGRQDPPRIIVHTGSSKPGVARQVLQLGGAGFCSKQDSPQVLVDTVFSVSEGRMVFPFMNMDSASTDSLDSLTPRERDLLASLANGQTNAQIAKEHGISLNTVKFHLKNLYEKLSVNNRAQAVARFLAGGDSF
ncbi:MAG: response regulator transcription factor [Rhodospirillales bacterium]|jgi:DNA-binding NarL/FixJ family response regulator|nr:response regulator transcription factor [Rhodospirillales bacterium]MBT4038542.1 response regulator transcription factor [Rhodospirillales bacterium]MBT4628329.1 response regulator transcription factor [Rhodospirillales bacterium]MBT5350612.1 response regulator transcription factor [Rhodospirillales bacterium]MBT5522088.1 response regulator transcription factor [Rhodospirillales bacterium]